MRRAPEASRRGSTLRHPSRRLVVLFIVLSCLLSGLAIKALDVQVLNGRRYAAYGESELTRTVALPAVRGTVYDRAGDILAVSVPRVDVVADDFEVNKPVIGLRQLGRLLGIPEARLRHLLSLKSGYVPLAYKVAAATEDKIRALDLPYVSFAADPLRSDPEGRLFSPVLGLVGFDGTGLSGLEYKEQHVLAGTDGSEQVAVGSTGAALPGAPHLLTEAHQGTGLVLTLDQALQFEVTKDLSERLSAEQAQSGLAVVMDTRTGGILSMVDLDRLHDGKVVPATQNLAVTAEYQPGSVMKLATISGALQQGLVSPTTELSVPDQIMLGGWPFADAEYHPTEQLSVSQILAQSSNVGTIEIAHMLGPGRLYHYLRDLGFGSTTGLDWPGETAGSLGTPSTWSPSSMGTVPIGTGEAVTAMQILDAYNAVANGGMFVPPRLIDGSVSPQGKEDLLALAHRHRVLASSTAKKLLGMLELVTSDGTALAARVPGYTVAGKTGTAQIPSTTGPGYQPGAWMATFVGFAPATRPRLAAIVVLNRPRDMYGGVASAPVFSEIMSYALRHFDVAPPRGAPPIL
ncbi:MAG: peptidoglycan D,D-transpeptidase FtsI family protein [Acidimicrobiales bacterium]